MNYEYFWEENDFETSPADSRLHLFYRKEIDTDNFEVYDNEWYTPVWMVDKTRLHSISYDDLMLELL